MPLSIRALLTASEVRVGSADDVMSQLRTFIDVMVGE